MTAITNGLDALVTALRVMDETGPEGFEGFVRDVIRHALGRHIRLLKSGHQYGGDALADSRAALPEMVIECKRYTGRLPFEELRKKLEEALRERKEMDLWVVAATVDINAGDLERLRAIASEEFVSVECLDWDGAAGSIPSLAALCATVPDIVQGRFPKVWPAFKAYVDARKEEFKRLGKDIVERLSRPDCGYALAQAKAEGWLRTTLSSSTTARLHLRSRAGLDDPETRRIRRTAIMDALDVWWDNGAEAPCVLLGKEGMGKTWAMMAWCLERFEKDTDPPLVLVMSAGDVKSMYVEHVFQDMLQRAMGSDSLHWHHVEHWAKHSSSPRILVIVDGLNQNFHFDWRDFLLRFERLVVNETSVFALALTCRPEFWERKLYNPTQASGDEFSKIPVGPFDNKELCAFLGLYGRKLEEFPDGLRAVMSVPRLSELAMDLSAHLPQVGEVTREMLYLAEWAHRRKVNTDAGALDPAEIKRFAGKLAKRFLGQQSTAISRREILDTIGYDSGWDEKELGNVLSDIVDGHWLEPGDRGHQYIIKDEVLPYVVGLDLVEQARVDSRSAAVHEVIGDFTDPASGGDFGTQVLRAASAIAIYDSRIEGMYGAVSRRTPVPGSVKDELLAAWLTSQNFGQEDEDEVGRLVGADPARFLDLAERLWSADGQDARSRDVLVRAFVRGAYQVPAVLDALRKRMPTWVGETERFRADEQDPLLHAQIKTINQRLNSATTLASHVGRQWTGAVLLNGRPALRRRAFAILSYLPRAPFIDTITAWSLSLVIFDPPDVSRDLLAEWVLRLNPKDRDTAEAAVLTEAAILENSDGPLGVKAGGYLREALATPAALRPIVAAPVESSPLPNEWGIDAYGRLLRRSRGQPLAPAELERLDRMAADDRFDLSDDDRANLAAFVHGEHRDDARDVGPSRVFDMEKGTGLAILRWARDAWVEAFPGLSYGPGTAFRENNISSAQYLMDHFLVLPTKAREAVSAAAFRELEDRPWEGGFQNRNLPWDLLVNAALGLVGKPAGEQVAYLSTWPGGPRFESPWTAVLATPDSQSLKTALARLTRAEQAVERLAWLGYLSAMNLSAMPEEGVDILVECLSCGEISQSSLAMQALARCRRDLAAPALARAGWRANDNNGQSMAEQFCGSVILGSVESRLSIETLLDRLHLAMLPFAINQRGCQLEDVGVLAERLSTGFLDETTSDVFQFARMEGEPEERLPEVTLDPPEVFRAVWQMHRSDMRSILDFLASPEIHVGYTTGVESMFVEGLLQAAMIEEPEEGASLWEAIYRGCCQYRLAYGKEAFASLPFKVDNVSMVPLRRNVLLQAITDAELTDIARLAARHGRIDWLLSAIETDLASPNAAYIARGVTLAGLLDESSEGDALWARLEANADLQGWLAEVCGHAMERYRRNVQARRWLRRFLSAADDTEALAGYALFFACTEPQAGWWAEQMVATAKELSERRLQHWQINQIRLESRLRQISVTAAETLFHTPICEDLHPWRRV